MGLRSIFFTVLMFLYCLCAIAQSPNDALNQDLQRQKQVAQAQQKIDDLDDAAKSMAADYRQFLQQTEELEIYNEQVRRLIYSQDQELISYEAELSFLEETRRQLIPLMYQMIETLGK